MDDLLSSTASCSRRTLLGATLAAASIDPTRAIGSAQESAVPPGAATRTRFAPNVVM